MTEIGEHLRKRVKCWQFSMLVLVSCLYFITLMWFYTLNSARSFQRPLPRPLAPIRKVLEKDVVSNSSPPPGKISSQIQQKVVVPNSSPPPGKIFSQIQQKVAVSNSSPPPGKISSQIQQKVALSNSSLPPGKISSQIQQKSVVSNSSPPPGKISSQIQHPYYLQECYTYEGLRATFTCTNYNSFRNYSYGDILECASNLWEIIRNKSISNPWEPDLSPSPSSSHSPSTSNPTTISKRPTVHLVMTGDSHIRNIFEVFLRRMANPRVKYRVAGMKKDEWKDSEHLFSTWTFNSHEYFHELLHLDVPLKITFYWDALLRNLPLLLSAWMAGKESKPTHLLIGTTLHYMRSTKKIFLTKGPKEASMSFYNHLKNISAQLEKFSRTTKVVFKLQDHLQDHPSNNIENPKNIDLYNQIATDLLPRSSSFVIWNSTVPLSDLYSEVCHRKGHVLPKSFDWRCNDVKHLGYIVIDQYLDMYLNDVCTCFDNKCTHVQ